MIRFLCGVTLLVHVQCISVRAITATGDHCVVQGLYVPLGETWQPAGKCVETSCEGNNVTSTKGCSAPILTEGWILVPEDPSKAYPDCCPKYVAPDSPYAPKPPLEGEIPNPPLLGTNSSTGEADSEIEVDSFESFDCCFHCCYHCCMELLKDRRRQDFDSSEESSESDESDESEEY